MRSSTLNADHARRAAETVKRIRCSCCGYQWHTHAHEELKLRCPRCGRKTPFTIEAENNG